jgi:hypothetical protein
MIKFDVGEVSLRDFSSFPDPFRDGIGYAVIRRRVPVSFIRPLNLARIRCRRPDGNVLALGLTTGPRANSHSSSLPVALAYQFSPHECRRSDTHARQQECSKI